MAPLPSLVWCRCQADHDADALGNNPLFHDGELVGRATSGGFGFRLGKSLPLGMLRPDLDDGVLSLLQLRDLSFAEDRDLVFHRRESLPGDANGMRFTAFTESGEAVHQLVCYATDDGAGVDEVFL